MLGGVNQGRASDGAIAGFRPIPDGRLNKACFCEVIRRDLGLRGDDLGKPVLQRDGDTLVQCLALIAWQHAVGSILNEGVAKCESLRRRCRWRNQFCLHQPLKCTLQIVG